MPAWILISAIVLAIRLPLFFLSGIGRDEATYVYWAFHWEPAYSPLLQILTRLTLLATQEPWPFFRMTSLLSGLAIIYLLDQILKHRNVSYSSRLLGLAVMVLNPWQTYAGAILHPDNLLLVAILLQLLAISKDRPLAIAATAILAITAKLSGVVILPVAMLCILQLFKQQKWRAIIAGLLLVIGTAVMGFTLSVGMLEAVSEFGKMSAGTSVMAALIVQLTTVLLLAGPAMPFAATMGWRYYWKKQRSSSMPMTESGAVLILTLSIFLFFALAILVSGQVKGNWILPAMVLLWPPSLKFFPGKILKGALLVSLLMTLAMVVFLTNPSVIGKIEQHAAVLAGSYRLQAGEREARVSRTGSWEQRLSEYQSQQPFISKIQAHIKNSTGHDKIHWIVCDDYGIASQVWFGLNSLDTRLIIIDDGLFVSELPDTSTRQLDGPLLVIGVGRRAGQLWERLIDVYGIIQVKHPQQDVMVEIAFSNGQLGPVRDRPRLELAKMPLPVYWIKILFGG